MPNSVPNIGGLFVPGGAGKQAATGQKVKPKSSGATTAKVVGKSKVSGTGARTNPQRVAGVGGNMTSRGVGSNQVSASSGGGGGSYSGGGGSYGGYSGGTVDVNGQGNYGGVAEPTKSIYDMSTEEQDALIKPDQIYNNEVTAYTNALNSLIADLDLEKGESERTYTKNLTDLGWLGEGQGFNGWDVNNLNTAFGNSYTNNENDFAARGMYDSSARAESLARLLDDFSDQRTGLATSQDANLKDISNRRAAGETTQKDSIAMARQNALARYAASLGVI